ncbi:MAG: trypsin-like peptidase domain-containing protein [Dehalococcoidia bacterium]
MKLPIWLLSLVGVLALLGAAACGDDDDTTAGDDNDETQEESQGDSMTDEEAAASAEEEAQDIGAGSDTATIARSVVQVFELVESGGGYEAIGWGSGTIIDPGGLILTNNHVIDPSIGYDEIGIGLLEETDRPPEPAYFAEVLVTDADEDLAVLQITRDNENNEVDPKTLDLPTVPLGDPEDLEIGDAIRVIGYPGIGNLDDDPLNVTITVTEGTVSGFLNELDEDRGLIKTDAIISPGNSGGAAFNDDGQLIGVPTFFNLNPDEATQTLNGIRPIFLALDQIERAKAGESDSGDREFVCTTCDEEDSEETPVEQGEEEILDLDNTQFNPSFSNFSFSTGIDADGVALDNVDPVPAGLPQFVTFTDYAGMVDGVTFATYCIHDNTGTDYGFPEYQTWAFGAEGTIYFFCFTEDGSPLPTGSYSIRVTVTPPGGDETPYGETTVTVQ